MPTVELSFSALPAHVRTARMVAVAVARRSGLREDVLDEVRLAVGEACSRAVELHRRYCPDRPVNVVLTDDPARFAVAVSDWGADAAGREPSLRGLDDAVSGPAPVDGQDPLPAGVGLAVITGLVDDVDIRTRDDGSTVTMAWPVG